jgi:hypothetical protein
VFAVSMSLLPSYRFPHYNTKAAALQERNGFFDYF